MSKSAESWVPSGGVLAVAIASALVAAILINLYMSHVKSAYENGAKTVLQVKDAVEANTPIQDSNLKEVKIPVPLLGAFEKAIKAEDRQSLVKKKSPHKLYADQILFYYDFLDTGIAEPERVKPGFELISINIQQVSSHVTLLQPGAYVKLYLEPGDSADPKRMEITDTTPIMDNVQVRAVGGSTAPRTEGKRDADEIEIQVKSDQVMPLVQLQNLTRTKRFYVTVLPSASSTTATIDPVITPEAKILLAKMRALAPGGKGGAAPPALPASAPPPMDLPPPSATSGPGAPPAGVPPATPPGGAAPAVPAPKVP